MINKNRYNLFDDIENIDFPPVKSMKIALVNPIYLEDLEKKVELAIQVFEQIYVSETLLEVRARTKFALSRLCPEKFQE